MDKISRTNKHLLLLSIKAKVLFIVFMGALTIAAIVLSLSIGSSHLDFLTSIKALFGVGEKMNIRIVQQIRLPRALAALIAGAALSLSGLLMQTTLGNVMASPSVLGVSNAAVFGANLSIIVFSGGGLLSGAYSLGAGNPFATSSVAFVFASGSVLLILALGKMKGFSPNAIILSGVAIGAVWTAATTILQYSATDVGLSAAVSWSFGDLSRATFLTDGIMAGILAIGVGFALFFAYSFNALLSGEEVATSLGVKVNALRFVTLLIASMLTAVCVSYLGIIGFVGMICPHAMRRIVGNNHRLLIPSSLLSGSSLVLLADALSRIIGNGSVIPVGAVTSLLGAPFFLYLVFASKGDKA